MGGRQAQFREFEFLSINIKAIQLKTFFYLPLLDPKMKTYIMGCTVDGLAFGTAAEGLQHYNGKKHRAKIARHLKDLSQESCAIHIKGT